jgi:poly-gamma-glutamate capsule biosynthesis protein CapA/YwtB (metallophosphatase superfamily)
MLFVLALGGTAAFVATNVEVAGEPATPSPTASPEASRPLTYAGRPPSSLVPLAMLPAVDGQSPDFQFDWGAASGVPDRYFVPLVAIGTGIDALKSSDLQGLLDGRFSDWRNVLGLPSPVTFAIAGPAEDRAAVAAFTDGAKPDQTFDTYDALYDAMTVSSGIVAFVPLEEVRMQATAVAIDSIDLVRGRGDPQTWPYADRVTIEGLTSRGKTLAPDLSARIQVKTPKPATIVATGDIIPARCSLTNIEALGNWSAPFQTPLGVYLRSADLTLASLDSSIQDASPPFGCEVMTNLTAPPGAIQLLTSGGIDEVTVATNHPFDCGRNACGDQAFLQTLDRLSAAGIKSVGGGRNLDQALTPAIFDINGVTFGVLGFDDIAAMDLEATATEPGTAPLDDDYGQEQAAGEPAFYAPASDLSLNHFVDAIKTLKQQVDVVIVQVHSGIEETHDPSPRTIKALRAAADAGADLVIGNHPHWAQAVEERGNAFIAYALGNFIFDQVQTENHTEGYLVEATFWSGRLVNVRLRPYVIVNRTTPTFVTGTTSTKILDDVFTATANLPTDTP